MSETILAWHFLGEDRRPIYGRRKRPLRAGDTMHIRSSPILCKRGLHASERILDALEYSAGPICCRVEVSGTIVRGEDKLVGTRRRIIAMADISTLLHEWACDVAEQACQRAEVTDPYSLEAIACKRRWLRGDATDKELRAAGDALWRTARNAARGAAWAAVWGAAGGAARGAAWGSLSADLEQRVLKALEVQP